MEFREVMDFINKAGECIIDTEADVSNIIGVAVGGRDDEPIADVEHDEFCLVAFVPKELSDDDLEGQGLIDPRDACAELGAAMNQHLDRKDIRVVEVGDVFKAGAYTGSDHGNPPIVNTQKWFQTLRPGIGIANPVGTYPAELVGGTAGFFVEDRDHQEYLVSCNHVIARARQPGERIDPEEMIIQPATRDLPGSDLVLPLPDLVRFRIAKLSGCVPIRPDDPTARPTPTNEVDVAYARIIESDRERALGLLPFGGLILGSADPYEVDEKTGKLVLNHVYKVGRTTAYTEGIVTQLGGRQKVHYDGWSATFINQIVVRPTADNPRSGFSAEGDSGSALLTADHKIAGLIFSGRSTQVPGQPHPGGDAPLAKPNGQD